MPNLTGDPNRPVNVTIRALEPTDQAIPDLWNVPFQQLLNNDANLNQRVSSLETSQGGTTLAAHRSASVLDHPDGSVTTTKIANGAVTLPKLASTAVSTGPTPNTLALRNAQGAVQDGAVFDGRTALLVNGGYFWATGNAWVPLVTWTAPNWANRGLFADLVLFRIGTINVGGAARLRARAHFGSDGTPADARISIANDASTSIINAVLVQVDEGTLQLWAQFQFVHFYARGVVGGTPSVNVLITNYGNIESQVLTSPPTPASDGLYLEWTTAAVDQTFPGPGYIVAASRGTTSGYVRYDNGIQIAWATIALGSGYWTYPAAFASTPRVLATAEAAAPRVVTITSVSTTAAGILRTDLSGTTVSGTVHLWAIGLWK